MWRVIKRKLPIDNIIMICGIHVDTRCTCCTISQLETLDQVFTTSDLARKLRTTSRRSIEYGQLEKPQESTWKIKKDGSSMSRQSLTGIGEILRIGNRELIMAFAK
ncbi:hypothetical protein H5410_036903 [Solanum commersonii]|uniref:Reverse transcriptase zinc-binding domain-containing protein n=1 Tax=Solanum commersonii TaxID=4109 RepID=A0A9J5Y6Z7_SOLCO|nr:hypothetical protein H5410_036903 [Solanum commersonii]